MGDSTSSSSEKTFCDIILAAAGNFIKVLPTGTVFLFQYLNPFLTNNGHCAVHNKYLSAIFIAIFGLLCFLASFTDSYTIDGKTHYRIVTPTGLWPPSNSNPVDSPAKHLRLEDFAHAFFSLNVFAVVSLLDTNSVRCFYPGFESTGKVLLQALPPVIGAIAGFFFCAFPNKRQGIGYPSSSSASS